MEKSDEEKKIDDILKDIHNDFMDYFDNIDIPKEGSTSFHGIKNNIIIIYKNFYIINIYQKIEYN